jgi:hypothetical protein
MFYEIQIFAQDCHKTIRFEAHETEPDYFQRQQIWENICFALGKLINQKIKFLPENEVFIERVFVLFLKQLTYKQIMETVGKSLPAHLYKVLNTKQENIAL